MRIGTATALDATLQNMSTRQGTLASLQEQLSSGKKVNRPSDDPAAMGRAERARTRLDRVQTDQRALLNQRSSLQQTESSLGQAANVLQTARDMLLNAANPALSASDRASLSAGLLGMRDQLLGLANQSDANGVPLFGGLGTASSPFVASAAGVQYTGAPGQMTPGLSSVPYAMDGQALWMSVPSGNGVFSATPAAGNTGSAWTDPGQVEVPSSVTGHNYQITFSVVAGATTVSVQDSTSGTTALAPQPYVPGQAIRFDGLAITAKGTPANGDRVNIAPSTRGDIFGVLERAAADIKAGAPGLQGGISRAMAELDAGMDRLSTGRSLAGEWLNRADVIDGIQQDHANQDEQVRSLAEDIDMVRGISDLQSAQTGLDAALKTYAQVQKLSLLNYLGG